MLHKTWIDGAREVLLDPAIRCTFYDAVFDLYFSDQVTTLADPVARGIFAMVRPYIIADRTRYTEKCEKNRQNALARATASDRKRPQADATNNNINSNSNSNSNINNNNISLSSDEERKRELFDCLGSLFRNRAANVASEYKRFIDYYGAVGWKTTKGAQIVSKSHAARQWDIQIKRRESQLYDAWYRAFYRSYTLPPEIWTSIAGIGIQSPGVVSVWTAAGEKFAQMIEEQAPKQLGTFVQACKCNSLQWRFDVEK